MAQLPFFKVGDYGQTIRRTIVHEKNDAVDVSAASVSGDIDFLFHDPDGNLTTKTGSFTNTGTDGQVEYVVESGLFDEDGTWKLQITILDSTGSTYKISTEQEEFTVSPVLS
jgi:hypothetical protein